MKKSLFIITFIFAVIFSHAQKVRFGLNFDPSLNWLKSDSKDYNSEGNPVRLGFSFGANLEYSLAENISFQSGFRISQLQGGVLQFKDTLTINNLLEIGNTTQIYKLQYIQLPLNLKMKTKEIGYITYFGKFGLMPSFLNKAKADRDFEPQANIVSVEDVISRKDLDIKNNISLLNLSMEIGGGIEYSLGGTTSLTLGMTFHNGFIDILSDKKNPVDNTVSHQAISNLVTLDLGILF